MIQTIRVVGMAACIGLCGTACGDPEISDGAAVPASSDSLAGGSAGPSASNYVAENAALARITMEEFFDVTIDIDYAAIGGFDLLTAAPATDINFCDASASARVAWVDSGALAVQYWHDAFALAVDVPERAQPDVDILLEHTAQRLAWNLRRAEEPVVDQSIVGAAHRVVTTAIDTCPDLPMVIGLSDDHLRSPWGKGSANDLDPDEACATDRADVDAALVAYAERHNDPPLHLEQVEAALLGDSIDIFFGSDLHVIEATPRGTGVVVPIAIGPCAPG